MTESPLRQCLIACVLVLGFGLSASANADCIGGDLTIWPRQNNPLPANGRLIIEAWGANMSVFEELLKDPAAMVSSTDKVPVTITLHERDGRFAQAIAKPARPLKIGQSYKLEVGGFVRGDWKIVAEDTTAPVWKGKPTFEGLFHEGFSCDSTIMAAIEVSLKRAEDTIFLVELSTDGKATRRFFVRPRGNVVPIGRPLCGVGPVNLRRGTGYSAILSAVDAAGHKTTMTGPAVGFHGPTF